MVRNPSAEKDHVGKKKKCILLSKHPTLLVLRPFPLDHCTNAIFLASSETHHRQHILVKKETNVDAQGQKKEKKVAILTKEIAFVVQQ